MSACDFCIKPGACCRAFMLSDTAWLSEGVGGAWRIVQHRALPFYPIEPAWPTWKDETGSGYQSWIFACSNLREDGRCGDYDNRPEVCRNYQPMSTALCAMHGAAIPARLEFRP